MKKICFGLLFLGLVAGMYGLGHAWTPLSIKDDPLFRMPGTQPLPEQNVILQGPGMDEANGCINCHGEDPVDAQGNVAVPGYFWQGSMMAQAARDPVFWATMTVAYQDSIWLLGNPNAGDLCLRCHFPGGWLGGRSGHVNAGDINAGAMTGSDFDGVHCDFCHRMWDPQFSALYEGTREGADWSGYWDEAEQVSPGSQERADATFAEDSALAGDILFFDGATPFFQGGLPPAGYTENGGGQYFVSTDNIVTDFQLEAKKRASFADTVSDHSDLYSRYHKSRFFCSTCHDVSNPALANLDHEGENPLPTEANPAYSYGHVERTFSEFAISAYGRQGGAPTNQEFQDQGARSITWAAKCQDCHMDDIVGKGCRETAAPLRPDESLEHPNSGAPLHNLQGGNAWVTYILGTTDDHFAGFDQVNFDLLNQGPAALTLDLDQGIDIRDHRDTLFLAAERAKLQLRLAASVKNLHYDPETGDLSFLIQNNTGHKLLSGYPEGRRMYVNIKAYDATDSLIYEVNPYADSLDPDTGAGGTLKGLALDTPGISPPTGLNEIHLDELVYEVKPKSDLIPQDKTFHFVLATDRYKDNRIPPKGFDIAAAPERLIEPKSAALAAPDLFSSAEYLGGYDDVSLTGVLPPGAARVDVALYYQGTSREYIQFLRDEINGTENTTLPSPAPSGEALAYIAQTDSFFAALKEWGDTVWSLWKHNHGFELTAADVPAALDAGAPYAGGPPVDGLVPYEMAQAQWPADATDAVTVDAVIYDAAAQSLTVIATSSSQPDVSLSVEGLGPMDWKSWLNFYRNTFTGVAAKPASVTVTSSGGGLATYTLPVSDTVTIENVTYDAGSLTVVATSSNQPNVQLTVNGHGMLGWKSWLNFYRNTFSGLAEQPASLTVTSSGGGSATWTAPAPDTVTIDNVIYDAGAQTMTVVATSNDQPNVVLSAETYGALRWKSWLSFYRNTFTGVASQPGSITVTSSGGGSATWTTP